MTRRQDEIAELKARLATAHQLSQQGLAAVADLSDWYAEFRYAATQVGRATHIIEKLLATPDDPFIRQLANEFLHEHLPAAQS